MVFYYIIFNCLSAWTEVYRVGLRNFYANGSKIIGGLSSYTSKNFFCTSKIFLNFENTFWPFKETHGHHIPKILPDVDFRKSKYTTSGSQNISPEIDFQKSKYITGSRLPKVKIYHRKLTYESQNISPEVDFRNSKIITRSQIPEIKNHHRKSTSESQKTLRKSTSVYKKNYIFYFILFFKTRIKN